MFICKTLEELSLSTNNTATPTSRGNEAQTDGPRAAPILEGVHMHSVGRRGVRGAAVRRSDVPVCARGSRWRRRAEPAFGPAARPAPPAARPAPGSLPRSAARTRRTKTCFPAPRAPKVVGGRLKESPLRARPSPARTRHLESQYNAHRPGNREQQQERKAVPPNVLSVKRESG